jgi:hypothetical protein
MSPTKSTDGIVHAFDDMSAPTMAGLIAAKRMMGDAAFKAATKKPEMIDRMNREPGFKALVTQALEFNVKAPSFKKEPIAPKPNPASQSAEERAEAKTGGRDRS